MSRTSLSDEFVQLTRDIGTWLDRDDWSDWQPADRLVDDLQLDSLGLAEIIGLLEAKHGMVLPDELIESIRTLGDIEQWVAAAAEVAPKGTPIVAGDGPDGIEPLLTGRHAQLRELVPGDYPIIVQLAREPRNLVAFRARGTTPSPEQAVANLWSNVLAQFAVVQRSTGAIVGVVTCFNADLLNGHAHLSVLYSTEHDAGSGWRLEGTLLFLRYLFATFPLRKLYANVPEFNLTAVTSGLGNVLRTEVVIPGHEYLDGRWWDLHILAIDRAAVDALDAAVYPTPS